MGFVGEVRLTALTAVPQAWAVCNGQLLSVQDYPQLFAIIGTTYGGDGISTFALPDLQGRIPFHHTSDLPLGTSGGVEVVTLTASNIAQHGHALMATTEAATTPNPTGAVLAAAPATLGDVYGKSFPDVAMASIAVRATGSSSPHPNMQPFLVLNFIICVRGIVLTKD